jgi:hypothetical protein
MMGLAAVAYGQSPEVEPDNLAGEVTALKTENIALREQLNKVEEQQMMLLEVVNDLKQRLGSPAPPIAGDPSSSSQQNFVAQELATAVSNIRVPRARAASIVIRSHTTDKLPSLSRWNHNRGSSRKR